MDDTLTLGMDVGSTTSKCLILRGGTEIVASALVTAGTGTSGPRRALEEALAGAGLRREDLCSVTATGYGRGTFPGADHTVSELSCHALGAHALDPEARTVIDVGGQDAKVLRLSPEGKLTGFLMNDKCAAGTGRFLEVMARIMNLEIGEMGRLSLQSKQDVKISSICTVFAESEVISLLAKKLYDPTDIMTGIHSSVVRRVNMLVQKARLEPPIVMTGGVAKNVGVIAAFERLLGTKLLIPEDPQMIGAMGAAALALETWLKANGEQKENKPYNRRRYY